ncbi:hypothetical protein Tco_1443197, partial [Tanacetum coccineum]
KGFLSPKGRGRGNGVKEKHITLSNDPNKDQNHVIVLSSMAMATNVCLDAPIPGSYNFDSTSGKQIDVRADLAKLSSIDQSSSVDTSVGNSMGPVSYVKLLNGEQSRKFLNYCTLLAPTGNGADVIVSID